MAVVTEDQRLGDHTIVFNRGAASSQAYASRFGNKHPGEVPHRQAYRWLSRGLEEALIAFIGQASDHSWTLPGALYEFTYRSAARSDRCSSLPRSVSPNACAVCSSRTATRCTTSCSTTPAATST
ncbi:MAG: hypothetical protein M3319_12580 [Actinomycetota bacterium]|nr:hypothetical protein [Actinomycetota bacterium]